MRITASKNVNEDEDEQDTSKDNKTKKGEEETTEKPSTLFEGVPITQ